MARDCPSANKEKTLAVMDRGDAMDEASLIASLIVEVPEDIVLFINSKGLGADLW